MDNFDYLPKLHKCEMIILKEVKRLCEENGIKYFIIAGTLLGAVRHGGFIPWDDDMDVGMLRDDYEKFIKLAKTDLGSQFFLQTPETDSAYGLNFAKIMLKDTVLIEATAANNSVKGISIDIFPFDAVPESDSETAKHKRRTYFLRRLLLAKQNYKVCGKKEYVKRLVYFGLKVIALFYSREKLCEKLDSECERYNALNRMPEKIVNIGGAYGYDKETIRREWVDSTVELPFEDFTVAVPSGYIPYLEYFYGDYMTPPPEDKRYNRHSVINVDFGPYA
ncbi:MAG: LicD family protein [Oscillospiraceae bacterium]|nr:LicD family protein [Oscillospiraceae bacterium]